MAGRLDRGVADGYTRRLGCGGVAGDESHDLDSRHVVHVAYGSLLGAFRTAKAFCGVFFYQRLGLFFFFFERGLLRFDCGLGWAGEGVCNIMM